MGQAGKTLELIVKGTNGRLSVAHTKITILRGRWGSSPGRGNKEIRIEQITAIQFNKVGFLTI